jgi:tetratricopeptide (TPR) repeat protein
MRDSRHCGGAATSDELLDRLAQPDLRNWDVVEQQLYQAWSRSGSASADYLLRQGRDALEASDYEAAYDHLTALTDHAPDFAEGWNARATLLFQMGAYGPSIADIQRVLALEPRHYGALTGLGIMLEEMGELETMRWRRSAPPMLYIPTART